MVSEVGLEPTPPFGDQNGFKHTTSSPHSPHSNGEAERAVRKNKGLLQKAADPYLALLAYPSTPLQHGWSPAELSMGRKLRSRIPVRSEILCPEWSYLKQFQEADAHIKKRQRRLWQTTSCSKSAAAAARNLCLAKVRFTHSRVRTS